MPFLWLRSANFHHLHELVINNRNTVDFAFQYRQVEAACLSITLDVEDNLTASDLNQANLKYLWITRRHLWKIPLASVLFIVAAGADIFISGSTRKPSMKNLRKSIDTFRPLKNNGYDWFYCMSRTHPKTCGYDTDLISYPKRNIKIRKHSVWMPWEHHPLI